MNKIALYLFAFTALTGCGGDDSNSTTNPNPNPNPNPDPTLTVKLTPGIYTGTTDEGEYLEGLVDDDNRLWFIYSENEDFLGFMRSNDSVAFNNSKFTALVKNYSFDREIGKNSRDATVIGNSQPSKAFTGTFSEQNEKTINYNVGYDEALSARKQTLAMINGETYNGDSYITDVLGSGMSTITFDSNGNFTGNDDEGCTMTGKFTPSISGRYFVSSVTFGASPCYDAGQTHTGVALVDEDNELIYLGTDSTKKKGSVFIS